MSASQLTQFSIIDFLNRYSYLGLNSKSYNKLSMSYILGKRNRFFLINFDFSFFLLKKSINFISHFFFKNFIAQSLVYSPFEKDSKFLKKNYINSLILKPFTYVDNNYFNSQIFFGGKWVGGFLTNWFKIFRTAYNNFFKKRKIYNQEVEVRKDLIKQKLKNRLKKTNLIFNLKMEQKFYDNFIKNKKIKFKNLFLKTNNLFMLNLKLPDLVIILRKNKDLINECHIIHLPSIALLDPIFCNKKIDYPIYTNNSRSITILFLKLFKSSIFLGRLLKLKKLLLFKSFFKKNKIKNLQIFRLLLK